MADCSGNGFISLAQIPSAQRSIMRLTQPRSAFFLLSLPIRFWPSPQDPSSVWSRILPCRGVWSFADRKYKEEQQQPELEPFPIRLNRIGALVFCFYAFS